MLCQGYAYFWTYNQKDPLDLKLTVSGVKYKRGVLPEKNVHRLPRYCESYAWFDMYSHACA